jgi:methylenetetrahydrofolate dehydrogenase (NADP+)/methenyltetrahydrofolate cyclohydrolase
LAGYNINLAGKKILLIGKGKLVGAPLEKIFKNSGIEVVVIDGPTDRLAKSAKEADVIIAAANTPEILHASMIRPAAVVVDAGVAGEDLKGNLADDVYGRDDITLTPKKGGVGPLTVCALFENVIRSASNAQN